MCVLCVWRDVIGVALVQNIRCDGVCQHHTTQHSAGNSRVPECSHKLSYGPTPTMMVGEVCFCLPISGTTWSKLHTTSTNLPVISWQSFCCHDTPQNVTFFLISFYILEWEIHKTIRFLFVSHYFFSQFCFLRDCHHRKSILNVTNNSTV